MSGIYFHIPFCKVKCSYCDFYKTTNNSKIDVFVDAIKLELRLQQNFFQDSHIKTIYFGGGTPSLLKPQQISDLICECKLIFNVDDKAEITLEANPDDLSFEYLEAIKSKGVNRLSIGIQSFSQNDLKLMKRRHNPTQAINAVKYAKQAGFDNISLDLIYGIPTMSFEQWKINLTQIFALEIQHLSAYHLTYHEGTKLWTDLKKGLINEIEEKESIEQFNELLIQAKEHDFIQYEISNFAKPDFFSQHNSAYWKQTEYLGLGPSAHSYNKKYRQWNVSSLTHYLLALAHNKIPFTSEKLSKKDRFNDYIITSLRTIWGVDVEYIESEFGNKYSLHIKSIVNKYKYSNQIIFTDKTIKLAQKGMFVSDSIITDFML